MILVFTSIILFLLLSILFIQLIDSKNGFFAVGFLMVIVGRLCVKRFSKYINQRTIVGELILEQHGFRLTTRDLLIPYQDVAKVWHCENMLDNYFTKRPNQITLLVKILTHGNEKYYWEMSVQPSVDGKTHSIDSNFLSALDLLEGLNPRYGLHQNAELRKLKIHEVGLAEGALNIQEK